MGRVSVEGFLEMKIEMSRRFLTALIVYVLCGALVLACFASASAAFDSPDKGKDATTKPAPLPFEPSEELIYQGEFSRLLLRGIEILEFRFTSARTNAQTAATINAPAQANANHPQFLFKGDAKAKGWFRKLFGIDFHFVMESVVDPDSFAVLSTNKLDEQGKRVRTSVAVFDRANDKLTWTERNPNDPQSRPKVVSSPLGGATHDFMSAIYYLRTRPLAVGQNFEIVLSDGGKVFPLPIKVVEKKMLKTVLGKKTPTLRVDIEAFGDQRLIPRQGQMTLWLTDDARRLPVRARIDTDLGTVEIKLKSVAPLSPKSKVQSPKS